MKWVVAAATKTTAAAAAAAAAAMRVDASVRVTVQISVGRSKRVIGVRARPRARTNRRVESRGESSRGSSKSTGIEWAGTGDQQRVRRTARTRPRCLRDIQQVVIVGILISIGVRGIANTTTATNNASDAGTTATAATARGTTNGAARRGRAKDANGRRGGRERGDRSRLRARGGE